ncbi:MAG TPA: hypothetical protein PLD87_10105 [Bacteroidia bacterium]|nr:hypothetical protein [Bacteroidia bacterium]
MSSLFTKKQDRKMNENKQQQEVHDNHLPNKSRIGEIKKCNHCDGEMKSYEVPIEGIIFRIPFTQIEIMWRSWDGLEWWCEDCSIDSHQERGREAYEAGKQDGYERAMEDSRRGW